jgi:hypothetical protein
VDDPEVGPGDEPSFASAPPGQNGGTEGGGAQGAPGDARGEGRARSWAAPAAGCGASGRSPGGGQGRRLDNVDAGTTHGCPCL